MNQEDNGNVEWPWIIHQPTWWLDMIKTERKH